MTFIMILFLESANIKLDLIDLLGKICIPVIIGYITFAVAKKQITNAGVTQFRQKWIENLRDSLSIFIAKAEMISMLDFDEDEEYFEHFKELSQMQHKVELLLNPTETDHNEIVALIGDIRELVHDKEIQEDELDTIMDEKIEGLMEVSKRVMKREWNVVKKGR